MPTNERSMEQKKPTVGLLYSGCGSAGVGTEAAGWEVKYLLDDRPFIIEDTWKHNFPRAKYSRNLEDFRKTEVDLIIGSPPCSRYSLLNRTLTRLQLYSIDYKTIEYYRFLTEINLRQPKAWILENLPRIRNFLFFSYNPEDSNFYVNYYDEEKQQMETKPVLALPDYRIFQFTICTSDVGLAQIRKRLFIIGIKSEYPFSFQPPQVKQALWLNRAIRAIPEDAPNHQKDWLPEQERTLWRRLNYNERTDINKKIRKMGPKQPCATIIGAGIRFYHWSEPRYLTPRECMRIQGFPDSFLMKGSIRQALNQTGKAIAPPIARSISDQINKSIQIIEQAKALDALMESK